MLIATLCSLLLALQSITLVSSKSATNGSVDLYLLAIGPYPDSRAQFAPGWEGGPALIPAVRLAVEHINSRSDILDGYNLRLLEGSSECHAPVRTSTLEFIKQVFHSGKRVVGVVGPACSTAALRIAPLGAQDVVSLIQVATGTSPLLNSNAYSNTFRTVSSSLVYLNAFVALIDEYKWNRIAAFFDARGDYFKSTYQEFQDRIAEHRSAEIVFSSPIFETFFPLDEIRSQKLRVTFLFLAKDVAAKFLCIAYHKGLIFPTYQWIFHDRSQGNFKPGNYTLDGKHYNCTYENMAIAMHGVILHTYTLRRGDVYTNETEAKLSFTQYQIQYEQKRLEHLDELKEQKVVTESSTGVTSSYAIVYYDSTWSLALGLNSSIQILRNKSLSLSDYSYGHTEITQIIRQQLSAVEFEGMTGRVRFNSKTRDSLTRLDISQLFNKNGTVETVSIGYYYDVLNLTNRNAMFIDDSFKEEVVKIHLAVGVLSLFVTTNALIFTVFLQYMYVHYHHIRRVKATSPNMNHLIFGGCYLIAMSAIIFVIQEVFPCEFPTGVYPVVYGVLCNAFTWCLIMGFSLIFGTVSVKMWRVYRIFSHFKSRSPGACITDQVLISFVVCLVFVDVIVGLAWTLEDPWILKREETFEENAHRGNTDPITKIRNKCSCNNLFLWIAIIASYKGLIIIFVIALSVLTRRIHRREFKDSKSVSVLVYSLTLVGGVGIPLYFILQGINIYISFITLSFVLNTIVILCSVLLFLPPFIPFLKFRLKNSILVTFYKTCTGNEYKYV